MHSVCGCVVVLVQDDLICCFFAAEADHHTEEIVARVQEGRCIIAKRALLTVR